MSARDGRSRNDLRAGNALEFNGRDQANIDFSLLELIGAFRWSVKNGFEQVALRTFEKAPGKRDGVQVLDDRDSCLRHNGRV